MKVLSIFIICGFMALPSTLHSAILPKPVNTTTSLPEEAYKKLTSLKIREVQKLIGRKLTFKEKISFVVLKHVSNKKEQNKKGSTALGFGIGALALLILGLFVPYVILGAIAAAIVAIILGSGAKRQDPSDKNARTAVLLGWITLGATALLLITAAIYFASGAWL